MAVKPNLPPMQSGGQPPNIVDMQSLHNDIGEKSGFQTDGYIDKKGTPYNEAARFNHMPPGMDIDNQDNADIRDMQMKTVVDTSYPGDGWE